MESLLIVPSSLGRGSDMNAPKLSPHILGHGRDLQPSTLKPNPRREPKTQLKYVKALNGIANKKLPPWARKLSISS